MKEMLAKFQQILESRQQQQQQSGGLKQPGAGPAQAQPLTPENLRQLQAQNDAQRQNDTQRRESKTKVQKGNDAPPAPTASQPPFAFGDQRGHGTPKYAGAGLKQEDLKLDPKRRKKNPPGTVTSTPATNQGTPLPVSSPQQTKAKKPEVLPFKCSVVDCEYHTKGFSTRNELDMHTKETHQPKEEKIDDPRIFFLKQTREGLGLDEHGLSKKKLTVQPAQAGLKAPPMQKSLSKASVSANVKVESKSSTPATMARGPSQHGVKAGSPSSNLLKTPQLGNDRTIGVKDDSFGKSAVANTSMWDESPITLSNLRDTFGGINMDGVMAFEGGAGMDIDAMMDLYMQSDAWTKTQPEVNKLPADDSSNESPAQNSEQDGPAGRVSNNSDTSKSGDENFVNIEDIDGGDFKMDDSWLLPELPAEDKPFDADEEWMNIGDMTFDELNMTDFDAEGEPWKDIDWEKAFAGQDTKMLDVKA